LSSYDNAKKRQQLRHSEAMTVTQKNLSTSSMLRMCSGRF